VIGGIEIIYTRDRARRRAWDRCRLKLLVLILI